MRENWIYRRGDIYMANLNPFKGSEQGGTRPVVVLQNDIGDFYCPTLIVAPLTSRLEKNELPTHYRVKRVRKLPPDEMREIDKLTKISLGLLYK